MGGNNFTRGEDLARRSAERESKVLSIDEFWSSRSIGEGTIKFPVQNNFYFHFIHGMIPDKSTEQYYQDFRKALPEIAAKLEDAIPKAWEGLNNVDTSQNTTDPLKWLEDYKEDLYQAYASMREFGAADAELFGEAPRA